MSQALGAVGNDAAVSSRAPRTTTSVYGRMRLEAANGKRAADEHNSPAVLLDTLGQHQQQVANAI